MGEVPQYSNGRLNYEEALDPRSVAVAERLYNLGVPQKILNLTIELPGEMAELYEPAIVEQRSGEVARHIR